MARFFGISVVLSLLACEPLIGADFDNVRKRDETQTASCDAIVPPEPPMVQVTPGDLETIAAITSVDYGDANDGWKNIGYDIDNRCTNQGDPPECVPHPWTEGEPTDGPRGQDNTVGKILSQQESVFGIAAITSATETDQMQKGKRAPFGLVRVIGYTGFADDAQVRVEWYATVAFEKGPAGGTPKLDGTDAWPVASFVENVDAGAGSPVVWVDDDAYVSNSKLVARFDEMRVPLANVYFDVRDVVMSATLEPDPAGGPRHLVDGVVAGVSRMDDLLTIVPRITYSVLSYPLCKDNENYPNVKKYICAGADIPYTTPVKEVCDGASFAIHFQTHQGTIGPTVAVGPPPVFCPPGTEPTGDSCSVSEQ